VPKLMKTVADMTPGEVAFVAPWALFRKRLDGHIYIMSDYHVYDRSEGTASLRINKLEKVVLVDRRSLEAVLINILINYPDNALRAKFEKF